MKSVIKVFLQGDEVVYCESMKQYHELMNKRQKHVISECLATINEHGIFDCETVYDSTILEDKK